MVSVACSHIAVVWTCAVEPVVLHVKFMVSVAFHLISLVSGLWATRCLTALHDDHFAAFEAQALAAAAKLAGDGTRSRLAEALGSGERGLSTARLASSRIPMLEKCQMERCLMCFKAQRGVLGDFHAVVRRHGAFHTYPRDFQNTSNY